MIDEVWYLDDVTFGFLEAGDSLMDLVDLEI